MGTAYVKVCELGRGQVGDGAKGAGMPQQKGSGYLWG